MTSPVEISLKTVPHSSYHMHIFSVAKGSDGKFYAVRETSPLFCLQAETETGAMAAGREALESYEKMKVAE